METTVLESPRTHPLVEDVATLLEELLSMLDICEHQVPEFKFILDSIARRLDHHIVLADATGALDERQWLEEALDLAEGATAAIDHLLAQNGTSWEEVWEKHEQQCLATVWH